MVEAFDRQRPGYGVDPPLDGLLACARISRGISKPSANSPVEGTWNSVFHVCSYHRSPLNSTGSCRRHVWSSPTMPYLAFVCFLSLKQAFFGAGCRSASPSGVADESSLVIFNWSAWFVQWQTDLTYEPNGFNGVTDNPG